MSRHTWLSIVLVGVGVALFAGLSARPADAGRVIVPTTGLWCGMTADGGSIRLDVTDDSNFVRNIELRGKVSISTSEWDRNQAQIKDAQFIYRYAVQTQPSQPGTQPRTPGSAARCVKAPCRPVPQPPRVGRPSEEESVSRDVTVRGTFEAAESLRGTYVVRGTGLTNGSGQYTAWPASVAPCP